MQIGKEESAIVWFDFPDDRWVTGWEIRRYRLDRSGQWLWKGTTTVEAPACKKKKYLISDLQNDTQYKFSVVTRNMRGNSSESCLSGAVMVEEPLPSGWFRFYESSRQLFYYSNISTGQTSRNRPERSAFFLDESIVLLFTSSELEFLQKVYQFEMSNKGKISYFAMRAFLLEMGEVVFSKMIIGLANEFSLNSNKRHIYNYQQFMFIIAAIKHKKRLNYSKFDRLWKVLIIPCAGCLSFLCDIHLVPSVSKQVMTIMFSLPREINAFYQSILQRCISSFSLSV